MFCILLHTKRLNKCCNGELTSGVELECRSEDWTCFSVTLLRVCCQTRTSEMVHVVASPQVEKGPASCHEIYLLILSYHANFLMTTSLILRTV
jgi:hypothetical protein